MDTERSNFATLCRLCLQPGDELTDVFTEVSCPYQLQKITLSSKIMACVSIKILPADRGPRKICGKCLDSVNSWFDFNEECKLANAVLQKFLHDLTVKTNKSNNVVQEKINPPSENSLLGEISTLSYDSILDKSGSFSSNLSSILEYCFNSNHITTAKELSPANHDFGVNLGTPSMCSYSYNNLSPMNLSVHSDELCPESLSKHPETLGKNDLHVTGVDFPIDINILDRVNANPVAEFHNAKILNENNHLNRSTESDVNEKANSSVNSGNFEDDIDENFLLDTNVQKFKGKLKAKGYKCELCHCTFSRFVDLLKHDDSAHEALCKRYSCPVCKRVFISANRLQTHRDKHREKTHKCSTCDKLFSSGKSLRVHSRRHIGTYKCDTCAFVTTSKIYLQEHLLKHQGQAISYPCEVCSKTFSSRPSLLRHRNIHLRHHGKAYKCSKCAVLCRTFSELTDHMNTHSDESKHHCRLCQRSYKSKKTFDAHMVRHVEPKFVCQICDTRWFSKSELRDHEGTHSDTKPFRCFHCDKQFSYRNTLIKHVQRHYPRVRSDIKIE